MNKTVKNIVDNYWRGHDKCPISTTSDKGFLTATEMTTVEGLNSQIKKQGKEQGVIFAFVPIEENEFKVMSFDYKEEKL